MFSHKLQEKNHGLLAARRHKMNYKRFNFFEIKQKIMSIELTKNGVDLSYLGSVR